MGWAKYAEDNFEIYLERMDAVRDDFVRQPKLEINQHLLQEQNAKINKFSQRLTEKSCFSLR